MGHFLNLPSHVYLLPTHTGQDCRGRKQRQRSTGKARRVLTFVGALTFCLLTAHKSNAQAIVPDWSISLDTEAAFSTFTVFDNNNDQATWQFYTDYSGVSSACYSYDSQNDADDWLVTPAISMTAGTHYKVAFHARANSDYYKENMEVKAATECTVASLANGVEIMPNTELGKENRLWEYLFTPTTSGDYYIGFHAVSPADANRLFLYDVSITVGPADDAPAAITDLIITPDPTGELAATLSFTAPSTRVDGQALAALDSIVIHRNGDKIATLTDVAPGSSQTYTDSKVQDNGNNTYTVAAFANGVGSGTASATEYIGVVAPAQPETFTIIDQTSSILTRWSKVTTPATEGRFNPDKVNYEVFGLDSNNEITEELFSVSGDTTFVLNVPTNEGEQHILQYALRASNDAGASDYTYSNALIGGAPYELPYREAFTNAGVPGFKHFWWMDGEGNGYFYGISTIAFDQSSSDGDNASLKFSIYGYNDKLNLRTGKIKLDNSDRMKMAFDYRTDGADKCVMNVDAVMEDESTLHLNSFPLGAASEWQKAVVNLPSYLGLLNYVMLQIQMECKDSPGDVQTLYIDNVNVASAYGKDLSVSLMLPDSVQRGKETQFKVRVTNLGTENVSGYQLNVTNGSSTLLAEDVEEPLAAFAYRDFFVNCTPSILESADSFLVAATVALQDDEDMENNTTTRGFALYDYYGQTISNLTYEESDGNVTLSWDAPATHNEVVTEDFESYTPWLTSGFGDWITVANDNAIAGSLFEDFQMPHEHENYAFMVTNFEPDYQAGDYYPGHSGYSYLSSVYGVSEDRSEHAATDHWLISPDLSGNAQTVSFYAMKHDATENAYDERVAVLYSTSDNNIESFVPAGGTVTVTGYDWQYVSAYIPEGAHYFAIESKNDPGTCNWLTIDDITYERGTGIVKSYRVYRDGVLIGTSTDATSFTDTNLPAGTYTYQVTALYVNGNESAPVSITLQIVTTGIRTSITGGTVFNVYDLKGTLVRSGVSTLKELAPGVYIVNGHKVVVR